MIAPELVIPSDEDVPITSEDESDEPINVAEYRITSFGIDYDVPGIMQRLVDDDICMPEFQRGYVWKIRQSSRFIESLSKSLPVPGIFLYRDPETEKQWVIDGKQRLTTLRMYYEGRIDNREFALTGVHPDYEGRRYVDLSEKDRRKLNNSIIHATIIRQDKPDDGGSSQFAIFERLNTNATPLSDQEVRAAIFEGKFNDLLEKLNKNQAWRMLFGKVHRRRRDEELILRFLSIYFASETYTKPMKLFLNSFMSRNRNFGQQSETESRSSFERTISTVLDKLGPRAFKPKRAVNAALFDALMFGHARRLERDRYCRL